MTDQTPVHTTVDGDVTRLVTHGELDSSTSDQLADGITAALGAPSVTQVVIDFAHTTFIDSVGIRALLRGYSLAQQTERSLTVVNARGAVLRVLELSGIADVLMPPLKTTEHG